MDESTAPPSEDTQKPSEMVQEPLPKEPAADLPPVITVRPPSPENLWAELVVACNYLTRINLPLKEEPKPRLIRKSMTWFPVIGAIIGIFGASVEWIMTRIGLPGIITATFAVISTLWMTRAIHEEEFASLANQYGQSFDREQRIGWLREERSVRYGTLGVILIIIMKIGAIASLANNAVVFQSLITAGCLSRALMVAAAAWLRPIEGDPVADHFQQPPALRMFFALAIGCFITFAALGSYAAITIGTATGVGFVTALLGANLVRGYNGPLLGTLQQAVELAVLGVILSVQ